MLKSWIEKATATICCFSLVFSAAAETAVRGREFSSFLTNDSTSPDLVFEGITLKQLTDGTYLLGGCLSGDWEPERPASFSTRVLPELADDATEMEVQFQYKSYNNGSAIVKWVDVVFLQKGAQIKAYQKNQGWVNDRGNFGTKIETGAIDWTSGAQTTTYRITRLGAGIEYSGVSGNVNWTSLPSDVIDEDIIHLQEGCTLTTSGFKFQNPVVGAGKIVVDRIPGGALKNSTSWHEWTGTLTLKGIGLGLFDPGDYGHMGSKVEVVNCSGYFPKTGEGNTELVITEKMTVNDGYTGQSYTIAKLSGDGTMEVTKNIVNVTFTDSSSFTGEITGAGSSGVHRDTKAILVVNEGETVSIGSSVDKVLTVYGNGGTITSSANIWADKNAITSLILQHDSTIGGTFALGLSATSQGATTADLAGYTLTVNKTGNFNLCNATISNGGTIDVVKGNLLTWGTASTMSKGTLKLGSAATAELNANLTVNDLVNDGATISGASVLTVNGTLSGGGTIPKLTMGDGATIKLSGSEKLTVGTAFSCGSSLKIDLSDYLALDQAPIVLPTAMTQEQMAKLTVIPPTIRPNASLVVSGTSLALAYDPMTLYWAAWRGTFWEHIGQTDVNGNHGLMRDEAGNLNVAHRPNDTVVFDRTHYTVDGDYLSTDYWHYDENLYIKNEVQPGTANDWDLKILEGVTLKMGLRGPRATGQNVISNLKIYVEQNSTLELGYWGNTHHYQGVLRDDVVFGGAGTITFGADLGPSLRAEGDVLVKNTDDPATVPTMNLNGKELVLCGKTDEETTIAVNLNGFGSIVAEKPGVHLTGDVVFGSTATIDASKAANMLTIDKSASFGSNLTVKLASAPTEGHPVKVLALGGDAELSHAQTDVRVLVGGKPVAAFYELYRNDSDGNLYVRVKETSVSYSASVSAGYDFAGGIVTVTMDPAIADLPVTVVVKNAQGETVMHDGVEAWTGSMAVTAPVAGDAAERSETAAGRDGTVSGSAAVMVGDEDHLLAAGNYTYTVSVGDEEFSGSFYVGNKWFETKPGAEPIGGEWATAPAVTAGKYQLTDTATFSVAQDKAEGELGVIEQVVTFESPVDDAALAEAASALEDAKGALTLAELGGAAGEDAPRYGWKGLVEGVWVELTGAEATLGTHTIRVEYDRTARGPRMRYLIGATGASPLRGEGTDTEGWFALRRGGALASSAEESSSDSFALESVSYVGSGALASLEGFVEDPALVKYEGVKYKSMEAAVAAWKAAGKSGVITLLTNIYFAPEPGTYEIAKNGHALYLTNDMIIEREEGTTVVVGFPPVVDRYTNGLTVTLDGETIAAPFIIDGEWLGKAIPWKRHSLIQKALGEKPSGSSFKRWQAYVLGFAADAVETAKAYVRAEQNAKQDKVTLDDGLKIKDARETGVVVTRNLVGSVTAPAREDTGGTMSAVETAYDEETGLPEFDLTKMEGKVQYLKISYEFSGDAGQEK